MASRLLTEMEEFKKQKLSAVGREKLMAAISYFKNNHQERRMNYAGHIEKKSFDWFWYH